MCRVCTIYNRTAPLFVFVLRSTALSVIFVRELFAVNLQYVWIISYILLDAATCTVVRRTRVSHKENKSTGIII